HRHRLRRDSGADHRRGAPVRDGRGQRAQRPAARGRHLHLLRGRGRGAGGDHGDRGGPGRRGAHRPGAVGLPARGRHQPGRHGGGRRTDLARAAADEGLTDAHLTAGLCCESLSGRPDADYDHRVTPPPAARAARPQSWHQRAGKPVRIWLMVFIVVGLIHTFLPSARWLMVHVFALGALANSVMLWSQHFTERFLRAIVPADRRRGQLMRIGVLNAAIVVTIVGMLADLWTVTLIGAVLVGTALAWHALALLTQILRAHRAGGPAPSGPVWFYVASALMLPLGAGLGATIAHGPSEPWYSRFLVAHQAVNLLGFIGLAAAGTLFWLAPRLLGFAGDHDPAADGAEAGPAARPPRPALVLTTMLAGIATLTAGALAGVTGLAMAGAVVVLLGWLGLAGAIVAARPPRPWTVPSVYAAGSVTAALAWLIGSLA